MTTPTIPQALATIHSYHAHIYYDPTHTRPVAERLREQIAERFTVQLGRWHDVPVGPHDGAMYQVAFATEVFASFVPWLMINRAGLSVLVHPNTDSPRDDHLIHALWLGTPLAVKPDVLPVSRGGRAHDPIEPNTAPDKAA